MAKRSKKFSGRFLRASPPRRPDESTGAAPPRDLRAAGSRPKASRWGDFVRNAIWNLSAGLSVAPPEETSWVGSQDRHLVSIAELKTELARLRQAIEDGETVTLELNRGSSALELTIHRERVTAVQSTINEAEGAAKLDLDKYRCKIDLDEVDRRMTVDDVLTSAGPESNHAPSRLRSPGTRRLEGRNRELLEDCRYLTSQGDTIVARAGFVTDLASIPRAFWLFIAPVDLRVVGPTIHDVIYRSGGEVSPPVGEVLPSERVFTRKEADDIFLEAMERDQVTYWKRMAAYHAVTVFGGSAWRAGEGPSPG